MPSEEEPPAVVAADSTAAALAAKEAVAAASLDRLGDVAEPREDEVLLRLALLLRWQLVSLSRTCHGFRDRPSADMNQIADPA